MFMEINEIVSIVNGTCHITNKKGSRKIKNIVIDSRKVKKGDVFIAIVGKEKNGHDYIKDVLKNKPACIIVNEHTQVKTSIPVIYVKDTLQALHDLARYKRKQFGGVVLAVTGSCGKTSTKEMLAHLLGTKYRVLKTEKNYNNHIGVPLTLLKLTNDYDVLVIECGTNHPGELKTLGSLVEPDMVVITNIGTSHIGNFKNKKAILKEKLSLVDFMKEGVLFLNGDDKLLRKVKQKKVEIYSTYNRKSVIHLKTVYCFFDRSEIVFEYMNQEYYIKLHCPGKGMVDNFLLALECSLFLNVDIFKLIEKIATLPEPKGRLEKIPLNHGNILLNDCYNASFESMKGLLQILKPLDQNKIIILGDMKEVGTHSEKLHKKIGKQLQRIENKEVYLLGEEFKNIVSLDETFKWFEDIDSLIKTLRTSHFKDSVIAVKGAHSMNLIRVCDMLKDYYH